MCRLLSMRVLFNTFNNNFLSLDFQQLKLGLAQLDYQWLYTIHHSMLPPICGAGYINTITIEMIRVLFPGSWFLQYLITTIPDIPYHICHSERIENITFVWNIAKGAIYRPLCPCRGFLPYQFIIIL